MVEARVGDLVVATAAAAPTQANAYERRGRFKHSPSRWFHI